MYYSFTEDTGVIFQPNYVYVYNKKNNSFDVFNETCKDFIKELNGIQSVEEIVNSITNIYEADSSDVLDDIEKLTAYLIDRHYLKKNHGSSYFNVPLELADRIGLTKLVNAEIEYTNRCNLKCKYCYAETNSGKQEISLEQWVKLLKSLYDQGLRSVTFSGGEPFFRKDFVKLLEHVHDLFIITINTNGVYINLNIVKTIKKLNLKCVQISLDSIDSTYHDFIRGKGTWQKAMEAVLLLSENNIPVRISSTITSDNESQLPDLKIFCKKRGLEFSPETLKPCGYAKILPHKYFSNLSDNDLKQSITFPLDTFDTPCQASLGFAAIGCDGFIKPCNLPNTFFRKIAPKALQLHEGRWYHQLPVFQLVKKSCDSESEIGPRVIPAIDYEYSQCVIERYNKSSYDSFTNE